MGLTSPIVIFSANLYTYRMKKLFLLATLPIILALAACVTDEQLSSTLGSLNTAFLGQAQSPLSQGDIASGLKEALTVGSGRAISTLSRDGGFFRDELVKIALPPSYQRLQSTLGALGLSSLLGDVELKINRAAESASAKAKPIFLNAIQGLTIQDALGILKGGNSAATDLLQNRTQSQLTAAFAPVVQNALQQVGAINQIEATRKQLQAIPFASYLAPQLNTDIDDYVVQQTLNGMFSKLALEEKAIRENPAKRTTELLQRVFAR